MNRRLEARILAAGYVCLLVSVVPAAVIYRVGLALLVLGYLFMAARR
jgi:hypothetical protein